ncbi:hypothetical protein F511_31158 [Dorcoceras hygrometricum]|uniref:Uncharacterized protein n=1 Tax=Dorcoceras hygrometricum TaxID=472368 RepID=A0A2Z7AUL7_9LAMI|nr:hypothetical protein F511_31158 [Dorcoceras hygrometricum]
MDRYTADLFLEVRTSMSYISPSSTSEGSTRRFDLTTSCTDPIPQPAAVRTPRLQQCTPAATPLILSILSVDCVEWLNILQQIVQQLFAQLLFILCHNTSRNSYFFVDWILCAAAEIIVASGSLRLDASYCDWMHSNSWFIVAHDWMCCCLRLVVQSLVSNACDWTSHDWVDQTMSYQLIQTTSFAMPPRLVEYTSLLLRLDVNNCSLRLDCKQLITASGCKPLFTASGYKQLFTASGCTSYLLITCDCWLSTQRASDESIERRLFLHCYILRFSTHLLILMTSSLLLIASSIMYADVITAVSRFLSISNADVNVAARSFLQYMC